MNDKQRRAIHARKGITFHAGKDYTMNQMKNAWTKLSPPEREYELKRAMATDSKRGNHIKDWNKLSNKVQVRLAERYSGL